MIELNICLWGYVSDINQIFLWSSLTASFFNADGFVLPNPQGGKMSIPACMINLSNGNFMNLL